MAEAGLSEKSDKKLHHEQRRMAEILRLLKREYPEAECSLKYDSPFQLLVATILSAQCTDERVNKVTPALFEKFPTAEEMSHAKLSEIEELVKSTNFFRNKARAIQETSRTLVKEYGGQVPMDLEKLTGLRGVGRKTANVVLGVALGCPAWWWIPCRASQSQDGFYPTDRSR